MSKNNQTNEVLFSQLLVPGASKEDVRLEVKGNLLKVYIKNFYDVLNPRLGQIKTEHSYEYFLGPETQKVIAKVYNGVVYLYEVISTKNAVTVVIE